MPDAVRILLAATDDAALARAVAYVGGTERAIRALFDEAYRLQVHSGTVEEILALVDLSDRVDGLARRGR